jgi:hypothetical protein
LEVFSGAFLGSRAGVAGAVDQSKLKIAMFGS